MPELPEVAVYIEAVEERIGGRVLEEISRLGGTHHSELVLGDRAEAVAAFARFAGLECCLINEELRK